MNFLFAAFALAFLSVACKSANQSETKDFGPAAPKLTLSCPVGSHLLKDGSAPWKCESNEMRRINPPCLQGSGYVLPAKVCQLVDIKDACPQGFFFEPGTNQCQPVGQNDDCPQGFFFEPGTRQCQPVGQNDDCPQGFFFEPGTRQCQPVGQRD